MKMWHLIVISLSFHLISAFQIPALHFVGFPQPQEQRKTLCDLGCKCPTEGLGFTFLDCSNQGISDLPSSLQFSTPVTSLSFQSNRLETLRMRTFFQVDDIQELDLSQNQIFKIENFTFAPFKSLALLRASHNRLSEVAPGLLDGLSNLRVLELGHNTIQYISPLSFQATPNLQELRLQYNPVFELHEDMFQSLPRLEKLDLQDTGLVQLPYHLFTPTPRLHWLSLSSNAFETVPEDALSRAPLLECLDLSGNDFTVLVRGAFRRLSNLSKLHLNNLERLSRIERDALAGLTKLKTFSCSYNKKLNFIDENAFGGENSTISKLKTAPREQIYLRQNALSTLKSPLDMESWSSLSFVDLADNPWKCDCNLLWMTKLRKETQMNIKCNSPRNLQGRSLGTVDSSELVCESKWAFATFILVISSIVVFGIVMLGASAVVCARTPAGLYILAKTQFSYSKVTPKTEIVDLEWDPSAEI